MKTFNLKEQTSIPEMMKKNMIEGYGYNWWTDRTVDTYTCLFGSMASFLKHQFSKKTKSNGFALRDAEGEFIIGAVLSYHAPDSGDEDDKGNFVLEFYVDEEEFNNEEIDNLILDYETEFVVLCEKFTYDCCKGRWKQTRMMFNAFKVAVETLKEFIFKTIDNFPGEEIEVTVPGVFTATGGIENDEKYWSITPGATTKQLVKDDVLL